MHIHLDLIGGLSGNMFVGAMLDHLKTPIPALLLQIERAGFADLVETVRPAVVNISTRRVNPASLLD